MATYKESVGTAVRDIAGEDGGSNKGGKGGKGGKKDEPKPKPFSMLSPTTWGFTRKRDPVPDPNANARDDSTDLDNDDEDDSEEDDSYEDNNGGRDPKRP